jgi:transmembrane sensor
MNPNDKDELWRALEGLRDRPIVAESRAYARRWARSNRRRSFNHGGLFAAALAAAAIVGAVSYRALIPAGDLVETRNFEMRTEILPDGSTVKLNTNSRLRVAFTAESRDVELIDGQAHFEVTHDAIRPFRVRAGPTEIVAIGTVFEVSQLPTETTVVLIEGRVDVHRVIEAGLTGPVIGTLLPAQQLAVTPDGRAVSKAVDRIDSVTAWERGAVSLDDVPLTEAIAKIGRYSSTRVAVSDPALYNIRVSGIFRAGDAKAFVAALERYFGLKAHWTSDQSVTLDRP